MIRTQVYLTNKERQELLLLSKELGLQQSSIIREAIDLYIENKRLEKRKKSNAMQAASGLWADRDDLPDFEKIRREFDR
jgi:Ribbon-helix-helix domain